MSKEERRSFSREFKLKAARELRLIEVVVTKVAAFR